MRVDWQAGQAALHATAAAATDSFVMLFCQCYSHTVIHISKKKSHLSSQLIMIRNVNCEDPCGSRPYIQYAFWRRHGQTDGQEQFQGCVIMFMQTNAMKCLLIACKLSARLCGNFREAMLFGDNFGYMTVGCSCILSSDDRWDVIKTVTNCARLVGLLYIRFQTLHENVYHHETFTLRW